MGSRFAIIFVLVVNLIFCLVASVIAIESQVETLEAEAQRVVAVKQEDLANTDSFAPANKQSIKSLLAGLSLQDFIKLVQLRNQKVIFRKLDFQISNEMINHARTIFDPEFVVAYSYDDNKTKNTTEEALARSSLSIFDEQNNNYSTTIESLIATGGRLTLGYTLRDITNNIQADDVKGKEYKTYVGATVSQPLLRNRGYKATKAGIRIAEFEMEIAFQTYRHEMIEATAEGEAAYWGLHLANQKHEIRKESVRIAEQILRDNKERVQAGKMSETEVLEAEAGLGRRKAMERGVAHNVVIMQNNLLTLLLSSSVKGPKDIVLTDTMAVDDHPIDFNESLRNAFKYRADYLVSMNKVYQEGIRVAFAENQDMPELDLKASYGLNGLSGSANDSWDDAFQGDGFTSWSVGVELRMPLGGRRTGSELRAAEFRKKQALVELKATEIALGNDIDASIHNVQSVRSQVENYEHVVELNKHLLEVELLRLDAGQSNSRIVLEREDILNNSREEMLEGLLNLNISIMELAKAEGSLLQVYGVEKKEVTSDVSVVN